MGEPPDRMQETAATKIGVETVKKVILQQSKYWKCLYPKGSSLNFLPYKAAKFEVEVAIISGAERMHSKSADGSSVTLLIRTRCSTCIPEQTITPEPQDDMSVDFPRSSLAGF
jgi:hypothetical protein